MTQIREAKMDDAAGVMLLAREFPSPTKLDENIFYLAWDKKLPDPNSYIGVAETENSIIGYVSGYLHLAFYANGSTFWVDEIFVKEDMRKNGVGRRLMESITPWIGDRKCKLIALATNNAKEFYSELGFQYSARYFKKYMRKTTLISGYSRTNQSLRERFAVEPGAM
jgi:GNAT superfamily N-acetyltransferase